MTAFYVAAIFWAISGVIAIALWRREFRDELTSSSASPGMAPENPCRPSGGDLSADLLKSGERLLAESRF